MFSDNNDEILFPFKYKGLLTCLHLYAKIPLIAYALFSSLQLLQQGSWIFSLGKICDLVKLILLLLRMLSIV